MEHADGSVSEYAIDSTAAGTAGKLASDKDAEELIRQELAAGSKITMTADANGTACEVEIVDALVTTGSFKRNQQLRCKIFHLIRAQQPQQTIR